MDTFLECCDGIIPNVLVVPGGKPQTPKPVFELGRFLGRVFHADAFDLLRKLPSETIDAVIPDPMFGVGKSKFCTYDWGVDPAKGDPVKHWQYHRHIYQECRRVLKPGGVDCLGSRREILSVLP